MGVKETGRRQRRPLLRDRWVGMHRPAFDRDPPRLEPWAVYVFEHPGPKTTWSVVGRLLQRPWSRVGGGGEHAHSESEPSEPARAWVARHAGPTYWLPQGSLWVPDEGETRSQSLAKAWRLLPLGPKGFDSPHTFESLGGARAAAQRMANTLCPRDQTRRSWPGGHAAPVDGLGLPPGVDPEANALWWARCQETMRDGRG